MTESNNLLRRYTDVTSLLHILTHKQITLFDPSSWDDKNDSEFLKIYKKNNQLKTLLALCFTDAPETHHHWNVFSQGSAGVCVRFDKTHLLDSIDDINNIIHKKVTYKTIDELERKAPEIDELPFLKRFPYRGEEEYRIIYTDKIKAQKFKRIEIDLNSIRKIVLSPSLHKNLIEPLRTVIKSIDGCQNIKIYKTTLHESKRWVSCAEEHV